MGTEIVFVIIFPVAIFCCCIAAWSWLGIAGRYQSGALGWIAGYTPVLAGIAVSLLCLTLITYAECYSDFTALIEQGYYTEAQRSIFLPRRVAGQEIVNILFVLPFIFVIIVPITARMILKDRLNLRRIAIFAVVGWIAMSLVGWLLNLALIEPPYALSHFLRSAGISILAYGLPVPIAATLFFRQNPTT